MKKLLFVFNPKAGKGEIRTRLAAVVDTFTKGGYFVTAYPTQSKGDAKRIVTEIGSEFDRVVCSGGDGTLSETISGLMELSERPVLGYLPAGTTNDFSRNLHLPKSMEKAAEVIMSGPVRKCDVGSFNGTPFIYVAAFGMFTSVSYDTPQEIKNTFGHLAYLLGGVTQLGAMKSYNVQVTYDEGCVQGEYIYGMVSNTVSVGGFKNLPLGEVILDDGLFEVMLIKKPQSLAELNSISRAILQQKTEEGGSVITLHTSHLEFSCDEAVPWTLDGEYGGNPQIAQVENCCQAIDLVWGE